MNLSGIDLLNLWGFAVGSMSLTIAIFYGFFVNVHNKNLDQANKFAKAINTLYAEIKKQEHQLGELTLEVNQQADRIDTLQQKVEELTDKHTRSL